MDKCPKCGANRTGVGSNGVLYECFSGHLDGEDIEGAQCLRRQVAAVQRERDELRKKVDAVAFVVNSATEPSERHDTDNMDDVFSEGVEAGYWDAINEIRRAMSMQESPTN